MKKPYQRINVNVFREILKNKFCPEEEQGTSKKVFLEMIQKINRVEIIIKGINLNRKKVINDINFNEYGYKDKIDAKIEIEEDVFEEKSIVVLKPKTIYELEENLLLPIGKTYKQKKYLALMSDTFERLKIKTENILEETQEQKYIEFYASKNIQRIARIFYEAISLLKKAQNNEDENNKFFVYIQTIFIMNTILYLQNMFSLYYREKNYTKQTLGYEIFETVGANIFAESSAPYGNNNKSDENKLMCNKQINQLITVFYDLMKMGLIEDNPKKVERLIYNNFLTKNGNEISQYTINTCLKDYRTEKRAQGEKRIDISKYI